jgi:hypothetical protein
MHSAAVQLSSLSLRGELGIVLYTDHVHSSRGAVKTLRVTCVKNLNAREGEAWEISS